VIPLDQMPALTAEQRIAIAVLLAARDVMREADARAEAEAARLRDYADGQEGWDGLLRVR